MVDAGVARRVAEIRARHGEVLLIVAPPRTASTALARILWNHPQVGFYSHEPFEATWYRQATLLDAVELLEAPTPIAELDPARATNGTGAGVTLVVKEMTFQVGDAFPLLAELATRPVVFLMRDPRLAIASRMRVLRRSGRPDVFPLRESGWDDLQRQLAYVRATEIGHLIVDSDDFRSTPEVVVPEILAQLGLSFSPELLRWESSPATGLSSVSGPADPFYQRVLASGGLEAPREEVPSLSHFPAQDGFRAHVEECVERYEALRAGSHLTRSQ